MLEVLDQAFVVRRPQQRSQLGPPARPVHLAHRGQAARPDTQGRRPGQQDHQGPEDSQEGQVGADGDAQRPFGLGDSQVLRNHLSQQHLGEGGHHDGQHPRRRAHDTIPEARRLQRPGQKATQGRLGEDAHDNAASGNAQLVAGHVEPQGALGPQAPGGEAGTALCGLLQSARPGRHQRELGSHEQGVDAYQDHQGTQR